jgi:hypothetical protein
LLLRQVIDGGRDVKLTRVFELGLDGQLRVTVGATGAAEPRRSIYKRKG